MYKKGDKIDYKETPSIFWSKDYDDDPDRLKCLLQHIRDHMLYRGNPMFTKDNPNKPIHYNIFKGNIDVKEVRKMFRNQEMTYGLPGVAKIEDYKFYTQAYSYIEGLLIETPGEVFFNNVSESVVDEKVNKSSKIGAAMLRNSVVAEIQEGTGENMEEYVNRDPDIPTTKEQMFEQWNAPQQMEYVLGRLVTNLTERTNLKDELLKTNEDHFWSNAQFALIDDSDGEPQVKYVNVNDVSYISPVKVEHMDDPNIIAWGVKDYISLENALRIYGHELAASEGINSLKDMVERLRKNSQDSLSYDPSTFNLTDYPYHVDHSRDIPGHLAKVEWSNSFYQPLSDGNHGDNVAILRYKVFFKIVKHEKAKVLVKGENPSSKELKKIKSNTFDTEKITYVPVDDDYKAKSGEYIIPIPKEELYQGTTLGHCVGLNIIKSKYQTKYEKSINRVHSPLIGKIRYTDSLVEVGKQLWRLYNSLMYTIDEKIALAGAEDIIMVDEAQMVQEFKDFIHTAKKVGFAKYNSTNIQDKTNVLARNHLTKVSLSPSIQSVLESFQAAEILIDSFGRMIGVNQQALGNAGKYEGLGKINQLIEQASYITKRYYYDDYLFRKSVFQRYGDIVKMYYGRTNRYVSVFFGKEEQEILKITKDLSLWDYESYIDIGIKAVQDKQFIMGVAERAIATGATSLRDFVAMYTSKSTQEAMAILSKGLSAMEELQVQNQQKQLALNAQANEINKAAKVDVPLQTEQMRSDNKLQIANIKYEDRRESEQTKAEGADVKEVNDREKMGIQAQIDSEHQEEKAADEQRKAIMDAQLEALNQTGKSGT